MTQQRYAFQGYDQVKMARALGVDLPISMKNSYEICNAIRGKPVKRAYTILEGIITLKTPIQFGRYNKDLSHKAGIGPGAFPEKAAKHIQLIIKSAEANAQFKGLNTEDLVIKHICVHKASSPWRSGRQKRRKAKRSHIEVVLIEEASKKVKHVKKEKKSSENKEHKLENKEHKQEHNPGHKEHKQENKEHEHKE